MRNTFILIGFLSFLSVLFGVNYFYHPFDPGNQTKKSQLIITPTPTPETNQLAKTKIARLMMVSLVLTPETKSDLPKWIKQTKPGGVVLFGQNIDVPTVDKVREQLDELVSPKDHDRILLATILDGGKTQSLTGEGFTPLPSWSKLCRQPLTQVKPKLASVAAQLSDVGINLVFAPTLDLKYASAAADLSTCSSSPKKTIRYAQVYLDAMDRVGIVSVMKHFPGVGRLNTPLNQSFSTIDVTKNDLLPFKQLIETNASSTKHLGVMTSLAGINQSGGTACSLTPDCVKQLINADDRVVPISDDLGQKAALFDPETKDYTRSLSQATYQAIMAGNDLIYFGPDVSYQNLTQVINVLSQKYVDDDQFAQQVEVANIMADSLRF